MLYLLFIIEHILKCSHLKEIIDVLSLILEKIKIHFYKIMVNFSNKLKFYITYSNKF